MATEWLKAIAPWLTAGAGVAGAVFTWRVDRRAVKDEKRKVAEEGRKEAEEERKILEEGRKKAEEGRKKKEEERAVRREEREAKKAADETAAGVQEAQDNFKEGLTSLFVFNRVPTGACYAAEVGASCK
jgi:flagellar biosynthesis/type III secretory pathway M-ring protein FliF/YscJ